VSPLAGVPTLDVLCARGYRPIEISSVLYQPLDQPAPPHVPGIAVRIVQPEEAGIWAQTGARGWIGEQPQLEGFLLEVLQLNAGRKDLLCFLAEIDGQPGAAGALSIHEGVALFAGAATVPELRRRGLQAALLEARLQCAFERGCDLAMMVAEAGSGSQRNAERQGFRVAYTRTKWRLALPAP
jgi:GNAT superfamily N-acetyltransferase